MTPEEKQKLMEAAASRNYHDLLVTLGVRKPQQEAVASPESAPSVPTSRNDQLIKRQMSKFAADRGRKALAAVIASWMQEGGANNQNRAAQVQELFRTHGRSMRSRG